MTPAEPGTAIQPADARWLRRAFRLASLSAGMTWPNPGVGCVLIRDHAVIGEGRHRRCGELHAETSALAAARAAGYSTAGATAYVTLAPCTLHGRQPPCVDALIQAGIVRVVAAMADPHQDDAAARCAQAGIAYAIADVPTPAAHVHGGFVCRVTQGRPRFTAKWAVTADGFIGTRDPRTGKPSAVAISDGPARELARRRRRAFDAILIGAGSLRSDDPRLDTPRPRQHGTGPGPLRIILAGRQPLPPAARAWNGPAPTLIIHDQHSAVAMVPHTVERLEVADVRDLPAVAQQLGTHGLNDVLVEGGGAVHAAFFAAGLYDRLEIYCSALALNRHGVSAPTIRGQWHQTAQRMLPGAGGIITLSHWERALAVAD